jgi:preprotein translocase subunit SecA
VAASAPAGTSSATATDKDGGEGEAPSIVAKGLAEPSRPGKLEYSAPTETGDVEHHSEGSSSGNGKFAKVSRNEPCPCGSGRKYKRCHGAPGRNNTT